MRFAFAALLSFTVLPAVQAQDLPDGRGKNVVENVCTACHGTDVFSSMHLRKAEWQEVINSMKARGAEGNDADFKTIADYLGRFLGESVNINKAGAKELEEELGVSAKEAAALVQYRKDNGDFKTWADVAKVPGLDVKALEPLQKRIVF